MGLAWELVRNADPRPLQAHRTRTCVWITSLGGSPAALRAGPLHLGQAHLLGAPSRWGLLEALRDGERPQGTRHVSHNQLRSLPSPGGAWGMGKGKRSGSSRTSKTGPTEAERRAGVGVTSPHTWGAAPARPSGLALHS